MRAHANSGPRIEIKRTGEVFVDRQRVGTWRRHKAEATNGYYGYELEVHGKSTYVQFYEDLKPAILAAIRNHRA